MQRVFSCGATWTLTAAVLVGVTGMPARAVDYTAIPHSEDSAIARAFGNGVHAFFGGDYQAAYDDLTQAIAAGTKDPRALYFRGLAARRMGRIDEAEADFSSAARLEADAMGDWPVSRTLERVQGQDRIALERHRVRSRIEVLQGRKDAAAKRYSHIESRQDEYLRRRRPEDVIRNDASAFGTPEAAPAERLPSARPVEPETVEPAEAPGSDDGGFPLGAGPEKPMAEREPAEAQPGNDPPAADASGDAIFE
jgi:tetratricopeptide (TPR) repeat protein